MTHVDEKSEQPEGVLQLPEALQERNLPMYQVVGKDGHYFVNSLWPKSLEQSIAIFNHHLTVSSIVPSSEQAAEQSVEQSIALSSEQIAEQSVEQNFTSSTEASLQPASVNEKSHPSHIVYPIQGALLDQLFKPKWLTAHAQELETKGGRGQTLLFTLSLQALGLSQAPAEVGHYCYRKYLRGGLIGKLISKKFFRFGSQARRAHDEFVMLLQMQALGLPVPRPLIAQEKIGWLTIENAIIIEQLPNTQNLAEIMSQRALSEQEVSNIGTTLAQFFKYNIYHTDLNLRNILLDSQGRCFVIDFDKCCFESNVFRSPVIVTLMLKRLERSFIKAQNLGHICNFSSELMRQLRKSVYSEMLKDN